jgi:hypothetical protein
MRACKNKATTPPLLPPHTHACAPAVSAAGCSAVQRSSGAQSLRGAALAELATFYKRLVGCTIQSNQTEKH